MKTFFLLAGTMLLFSCTQQKDHSPDPYNIIWTSPSADHNGSMPLGNGNIGLNVWVEPNGDLCFYIGKTDSWGDNGRLLKVGKVSITTEPVLFRPGDTFKQELDLKTGTIRISSLNPQAPESEVTLNVWVDADNPAIHIESESKTDMSLTARIALWRTDPYALPELSVSDLLENRSKPGKLHEPVIVEPDHIITDMENRTGWYHHNRKSVGFDLTNRLQGLSAFFDADPILHRTFGAVVTGQNAEKVDDVTLKTSASRSNRISVFVKTVHPATAEEWLEEVEVDIADFEQQTAEQHRKTHEAWWAEFWERSWIHVRSDSLIDNPEDDDAFIVSRAYALQRFIDAGAGRGAYPIKFNGSIFTVPYPDLPGGPDYRRWGPGYWWQNTRLPYLSMCAAGDFDLMKPFFTMYADDIYEICLKRTQKYFGFEGAYFPECMYFWGSVFTASYGWTPYEEREDKLQESGWHKWEWVAGPELVFMMLDYYDYTQDEPFLRETILPVAKNVAQFFDNYYETDENGKLHMHPSMACETWWDCTNPMPEVAGLRAVSERILFLEKSVLSDKDRKFWTAFSNKIPELPLRDTPDGKALAPAERFAEKRNIENPELYAVFPFRHIAVGNANKEWGVNALNHRWDKGAFGWRQDDLFMSYLGLAERAKKNLVERSKNHHKDSRFPAFWGPNYDWIPDQDHGGVLMRTLQSMLIQADPYSKKIYLLPAWPEGWNAAFKLRAPYNTVIQGAVENGTIKDLKVTPASRKADVVIATDQPKDDQMLTIAVTTGGHDFEQEPFFTMFNNLPGIRYEHIRLPDEADKLKPGFEKKYDVLVRYDMVEAFTEAQQGSYKNLLKQGIGVVALHHNLGAHRNWNDYTDMIGGKYVFKNQLLGGEEHAPSDYKHDVDIPVRVVDEKHPVTKGIPDFTIHDETYKNYLVSPQSKVLLTTDSPDSDPELAWVTHYEKSPVVYLLLGHDSRAWENPVYPKLLLNAIKWVANK